MAVELSSIISLGDLNKNYAVEISSNSDGDKQKSLDVIADTRYFQALKDSPVAVYVSEEREDITLMNKSGTLLLAIDPLDGSSNIETNLSIGSIFSIFSILISNMRAFECIDVVIIGICQPIQDWDLYPKWFSLPEISAQDICSPEETNTSYSEEIKFYKPKLRFVIPINDFHYPKKLFNEFKKKKYSFKIDQNLVRYQKFIPHFGPVVGSNKVYVAGSDKKLRVFKPDGRFFIDYEDNQNLLFIACGSGITPVISIMDFILKTKHKQNQYKNEVGISQNLIYKKKNGNIT